VRASVAFDFITAILMDENSNEIDPYYYPVRFAYYYNHTPKILYLLYIIIPCTYARGDSKTQCHAHRDIKYPIELKVIAAIINVHYRGVTVDRDGG
jgi:hypothetical protein